MKLKQVIKSAVRAKVATAKAKVAAKVAAKAKCKGGKCSPCGDCSDGSCSPCSGGKCKPCAVTLALVLAATLCGCRLGEQPTDQRATQRAQTATTNVYVYDNARATFGSDFVSQMQANETSGTETQTSSPTSTPTSTPTVDVKPDIDVAYNDAIKNATDASKGVLEKLTDAGAATVLKMMAGKQTGVVTVPTKDGGTMLVNCVDGQCSDCSDGSCTP